MIGSNSDCTKENGKLNIKRMINRRHSSTSSVPAETIVLDFRKKEKRHSMPVNRICRLAGSIANDVTEKLGIAVSKNRENKDEDFLTSRIKQLIIDDDVEWSRFQNELRVAGITTNQAIRQRLRDYINMREEEEYIDTCLNAWKQSEKIFLKADSRFSCKD